MPPSRTTTGIFLVVLLSVVGYVLVVLPPNIVEQFHHAYQISPWMAYLYVAIVGVGSLLLSGLLLSILFNIWRNTRQVAADRSRRGLGPSQMSVEEQHSELSANLAEGLEYAASTRVTPEVQTEIAAAVAELESKRESRSLEIVAFGTISSGKSSLLNALAGRNVFRANVVGGTTATRGEVPWVAAEPDQVVLVDTPGLAEVRGETRAADSAAAAQNADLVLFVVDGPLKAYESELLHTLGAMEKRVVVCLNKEDWYDSPQRDELLRQIVEQVRPVVQPADVVAVRSHPATRQRMHVLPDGNEQLENVAVEPDIEPLAERMLAVVDREGSQLLLANLLMQSRGLVDDAKNRVLASLDRQADAIIEKYMWAAGGAAAINPFPLLDLAGGSAIVVKMVLDLASVYGQKIDTDTIVELLGQLGKNLVAMVGASAAAPALGAALGSLLKTVPGVGTIAGGAVQGLVQALVARWIGRVFRAYFRNEMQPPPGGLAELARREWEEVTKPDQLKKLIQMGRNRER
ncbi:MAG: DUF697 domain-containing protein [Pirellulales bacterium]|nr:DUF697 domain-containing protein [Pirellulales bacterium]